MTEPSATQAETVLNGKLGELLIARHPRWNEHNVFVDATRVLRDHPSEQIDCWLRRAADNLWRSKPSSDATSPN